MSVFCAYTRRPGLLIRLRPETTGTLPSTYLSSIRSIWAGPARSSWTSAMKPSSLRMRAISRFVREAGTIDLRVACPGRVADTREHVRDRVGDVHFFVTSSTS